MKVVFQSKIEKLNKLKMCHITVTKDELLKFRKEDDKGSIYNQRLIITINNVSWRGVSISLGNNRAFIPFSKSRMKEAVVAPGDVVSVELKPDNSINGFDVPEEFEEVLKQDDEARSRFESLTIGKQRAIIYIVIQLKSTQKRIEKSLFLMENLKKAPKANITMRNVLGKDSP